MSQRFRTCLKLVATLTRQKLHRVASCVNRRALTNLHRTAFLTTQHYLDFKVYIRFNYNRTNIKGFSAIVLKVQISIIKLTIGGLKPTRQTLKSDKLYTSLSTNTITAKLTNHSGCRNVCHQQQFFFKTTLTWMITQYELLCLNRFLSWHRVGHLPVTTVEHFKLMRIQYARMTL